MTRQEYYDLVRMCVELGDRLLRLADCRGAIADAGELYREAALCSAIRRAAYVAAELEADTQAARLAADGAPHA